MRFSTKNIFLDTNIYEENNFFHSSQIQSLFYYSRIGVINLYMTTISKKELIDRMKKRITETKEDHNKIASVINKTRILRNLAIYEKYEKPQITIENSIRELSKKLELIIKLSNIKIISAETVEADEVFNLYYDNKPPFSLKAKKFEFPDAFIINSIDTWCKVNKKKMIFLTRDTNFEGYKSSHLIFRKELTDLLADITKYFDNKKDYHYLPLIEKSLNRNEEYLLSYIDTELDSHIRIDLDFEKVSDLNRKKPKFLNYKITSIRPDYAEITYNIEFDFSLTIYPSKEDIERSIFSDNLKPKKFSNTIKTACDLEINLKKHNEIKLKWINSNNKLFINLVE